MEVQEREQLKVIWATGVDATAMRTAENGTGWGREITYVYHHLQDIQFNRELTTQIWHSEGRNSPARHLELEGDELWFKIKAMKTENVTA